MNVNKIKSLSLMIMLFAFCSACNSGAQETAAQETAAQETAAQESTAQVINAADQPINTTVENGRRLSEEALLSYLPEVFGGLNKSGDPRVTTSEPDPRHGGIRTRVAQVYTGDNGNIYLHINDDADHQESINSIQRGMSIRNYPFSKTYQNDKGWYVTESFEYRAGAGEDTLVTSRTLSLRNPRFHVEFKLAPPSGEEVPGFEYLMALFEESHMPALFELEIPQGEVTERSSNLVALDCNRILPVDGVARACNVSGIQVYPTNFEKENNCNRRYKYPGNLGGLVFILSQYEEAGPAEGAVTMKLNDSTMDPKKVNNLGENAVLTTVGEDLYLSVADDKYLIELRSFKDEFAKPAQCCICQSEEILSALAKEVLQQLSK